MRFINFDLWYRKEFASVILGKNIGIRKATIIAPVPTIQSYSKKNQTIHINQAQLDISHKKESKTLFLKTRFSLAARVNILAIVAERIKHKLQDINSISFLLKNIS
ncbi:hypothetical protein OAH98_03160 [Methylophilaceae bacterium]|nr:hypothetical protein [Methylophilaceae bacterium]